MVKVLLAVLLVLVMMGISMEINAEEKSYRPYDVVCATLAFNAGYDKDGEMHAAKVQPYYEANKRAIMYISSQVVSDLAEGAQMKGKTLPYVARQAYIGYCKGDRVM